MMKKEIVSTQIKKITSLFNNQYIVIFAFLMVGILRFYYCCQTTINTGDTLRHISWGLFVNQYDLSVINLNLTSFHQELKFVAWNHVPFNYPIITLIFDRIIAYIYPSLFCMKLALTIIEFFNSLLIHKITKNPLMVLFYWASPISVWWVSHEGQFEPLQNMFIFLALLLFADTTKRNFAYLVLGLAIQVKLTAMFLIPYFVFNEEKVSVLLKRGCFFLVSFTPTLLLFSVTNPFGLILKSLALRFNPYYFNFFDKKMSLWLPNWLIFLNQLVTYGLLIIFIIYGLTKKGKLVEVGALIVFLIFLKIISQAQPWYLLTLYPFFLAISDVKLRNALWFSCFFLEVTSYIQILFGPFGYTIPNYYKPLNNDPFMKLSDLF